MTSDALIIGSGPAGLHAAIALRRAGFGVTILERDPEPGGIPRWCDHYTFPCRVKKRLYRGPEYARVWTEEALRAGAAILTETTVLRLDAGAGAGAVETTSPRGLHRMAARAILLATGARESPRHHHLIPGDRPQGVFTTGSLFQFLYRNGTLPGSRFVVYGSEDVSYSCIHALRRKGARIAGVVEPAPATRSFPAVRWFYQTVCRIPHFFGVDDFSIHGRGSVGHVRAAGRRIDCDAVVFTGGFLPNAELVRECGLGFDGLTRGPAINQRYETSHAGIFAAGNCLRGVVTGDEAAAEGRRAGRLMAQWLAVPWPREDEVALCASGLVKQICPSRLARSGGRPSPVAVWPSVHAQGVELVVREEGRVVWSRQYARVQPERRLWIPGLGAAGSGVLEIALTERGTNG